MVYFLNSPVLTGYGEWRFQGPLSVDEARAVLKGGFTSAIGHEETAAFLQGLLGIEISQNRIQATLTNQDAALILWSTQRLPKNSALTTQMMAAMWDKHELELGLLTPLTR